MRTMTMLGSLSLALMMSCFTNHAQAQGQSIQTGDGLLTIATDMPAETTQGDQFQYSIQVTNASDNVVLHQIKLKQTASKGFSIESVSMNSQDQSKSNASKSGNKSGKNKSQDSKKKQDKKKQDKKKKKDSDKSSQSDSKQSKSQSSMSKSNMTIEKLEPGQSETLYVSATADKEGQLRSCLEIVSYRPAICMTAKVTKPELELTKSAPKKANRCDVIELEYALKNGGSGDVGAIQITDDLGDGLATIEGKSKLKFDIDGLNAGETRNFVARVFAKKAGNFSSRATAKAKNNDLSSRSEKTETNVIATDLAVQLDGPNRIYGDQLATFTATVTNEGNADAKDVRVQVMWPESSNLADMGDVSKKDSGKSQSKSGKSNNSGQPTPAISASQNSNKKQGQSGNKSGSKKSDSSDQSMSQESFTISQLKAGESAEFTYAVRPSENEEIPTKVVARYVCSIDAAQDVAEAESTTKAMAMMTAKVVRLPALQLIVVDGQDPVAKDNEVVYTVRVWNEGDAKDQNVKLSVELPESLKFESAEGPTEFSQDGSKITFDPIDTVEAGTQKDYKLTATVDSASGKDIRVKAKLTSDALQNAVTAEEPTRLFSRQASR